MSCESGAYIKKMLPLLDTKLPLSAQWIGKVPPVTQTSWHDYAFDVEPCFHLGHIHLRFLVRPWNEEEEVWFVKHDDRQPVRIRICSEVFLRDNCLER